MSIKVINRREPPKPIWYKIACPHCQSEIGYTEEEVYVPELFSTGLIDCPVCGAEIYMPKASKWEVWEKESNGNQSN